MQVLVSIVIPVYNAEQYLQCCLDSVLSQSHRNIEVICVDDGSTDASADIIRSYMCSDDRVQLICQKNCYAGVARNNGLAVAKGKYVVFWDADDFFHPQFIEKMCSKAEQTCADFVICNSRGYDQQEKKFYRLQGALKKEYLPPEEVFSSRDIPDHIFQLTAGWAWDKLYNLSFVKKKKLFFQDTRIANDQLFVDLAYVEAERIAVVDEYLIYHRSSVETSLEYTRHKWWMCSLSMLYAEKEQLELRGFFSSVEKSFVNRAAEYLVWYACTLNNLEFFHEFYNFMQQRAVDHLELLKHPREDFYNSFFYEQISLIATCSESEYLFSRVQELNLQIAQLHQNNRKKRWYLPEEKLPFGSRLVVYGYGDVGRDFCKQLQRSNYLELVMVVDRDPDVEDREIKVCTIDALFSCEFDYIVIAILNPDTATQVQMQLSYKGIPEEKIKWFDLN